MSYADEVLADSPLVYWKLDEASGAPQDSSGNARHGTVVNAFEAYQAGALRTSGQSVSLERTSQSNGDYAQITDADWMQGILSVEAWVRLESLPANGAWNTICDKNSVWNVFAYNDGGQYEWGVELQGTGGAGISLWKWDFSALATATIYHLLMVWTPPAGAWAIGDMLLYVNGSLYTTGKTYSYSGTNGSGTSYLNNSAALKLGVYEGAIDPWDGQVSDLAFYPTSLSSGRASAHYSAGTAAEGGGGEQDSPYTLGRVISGGARLA